MVTISSFWFMVLIELLIATALVSVLFIVFSIMRRLRDRKAATQIIHKVMEDEARRAAETKKIMLHKFGFEDVDAEKIAVKISHNERGFYQTVINMYLRRDAGELEKLNIAFEGTVDTYRTLEPPGGPTSGKPVNESKELRLLKEENKRLSEEISVTMQTMGRMLSEYSAMFAKKAEEKVEVETSSNGAREAEHVTDSDTVQEQDAVNTDKEIFMEESNMVEEMDDLSDLDADENKDLKEIEAPDNPDELLG